LRGGPGRRILSVNGCGPVRGRAINASIVRSFCVPSFFAEADAMRGVFDQRVGPSRGADPARFVWDYWHVPGQYSYFRTHTRRFFRPDLCRRFTAAVRQWGETHLGCSRISEPWLSYYIDGCRQELHTDVPIGPWAFVFSLTRWEERRFTGGETLLVGADVLDYWTGFDANRPLEANELLARLPTRFNQLTVFDARVPHGVARVEGTHDPTESRIVVHGWFLAPSLSVRGALRPSEAAPTIAQIRGDWRGLLARAGGVTGIATWRLRVSTEGSVVAAPLVADTLVATSSGARCPADVLDDVHRRLCAAEFPRSSGETVVTLPLSTTHP
jgi:hypothetical protein